MLYMLRNEHKNNSEYNLTYDEWTLLVVTFLDDYFNYLYRV